MFNVGDTVICIDDTGWLIPDPGYEHLSPKKGQTYTIREYTRVGGVGAISLIGGNQEDFYRACRFRKPVDTKTENRAKRKEGQPA